MNKKSGTSKNAADKLVKTIRRKTRRLHFPEEKIRIVLAGLRGEEQHRCSVPPRGDQREPVLFLVKGVSGSRQATPDG